MGPRHPLELKAREILYGLFHRRAHVVACPKQEPHWTNGMQAHADSPYTQPQHTHQAVMKTENANSSQPPMPHKLQVQHCGIARAGGRK